MLSKLNPFFQVLVMMSFLLALRMLGFTFAAVYQLAFPRRRMAQGNRGEDFSKRRESGFYKFFGIGGAHGLEPQAKHKGCQSAWGRLMFHDQHDAVLANHPFHFGQRLGSIRPFKFVQRVGTAYRVEGVVGEWKGRGVSFG